MNSVKLAATAAFAAVTAIAGVHVVQAAPDHLQCHKVKDSDKPYSAVVALTAGAQFQVPGDCAIKGKAAKYCVAVDKTVIDPGNAPGSLIGPGQDLGANDYVCYKLKCPKTIAFDALITHQFAARDVTKIASPKELCVPAVQGAVTTTTTMPPGSPFAGYVTHPVSPSEPGTGVSTPWFFNGEIGIEAGHKMCQAIGADHVCEYAEVVDAEDAGDLAVLPEGQTFWVHRVTVTVMVNGSPSPPGPGGRCNDWVESAGHVSDGEYGAVVMGAIQYFFDQDTAYTGNAMDGHAGGGPFDGGPCDAARAILCCN